ncbi:MAG: pilus assembly protein [Acidobacteria bacterium]|jgi:Flp pilus assembly protein TadG|nr:pilus assembly protein [Acidobacteriota bacterium]
MKPARIDRQGIRKPNRQRGIAAVEVALITPILVILFLGIVDVGLLIWEHQIIQNAVREGARYSALPFNSLAVSSDPATTLSNIKQFVVNYAARQNVAIGAANITVNQQYPIAVNGLTAYGSQVTVSYPRSLVMPGGGMLGFTQVNLGATSIFRNLY